ncbi:hypothetical protein B0H14DRAFT_2570340 [Mycena olivaceomarginata]|nr:hypothetical protein B0H14DRAFT_2570340 [Mycena olivaceomarginata]
MHNSTELEPSDTRNSSAVPGNTARTTDANENNLPRPSLHLGVPGTLSTAQIIGLTRGKAVISREDLEEELRRKDNQINELKDLFISRMEDHEKEQRRKDSQLSELMNRVAALEINLADRNPPSVKITPWRVFNTLLVLGLGVYKSVGTYQGQTVGPTTVDWIGSLVWATIVYWVSLYEPLVDDDPDSEELFVWIFCRDLSGINLLTFPVLWLFVTVWMTGFTKLIGHQLQFGIFLDVFIIVVFFFVFSLVYGIAGVTLWLCLLPKLGSLLPRHIPPFFRILPFDSSDWIISDRRWYWVFMGLFSSGVLSA